MSSKRFTSIFSFPSLIPILFRAVIWSIHHHVSNCYFIRLLLMILLANYYYPIRIRLHFPSNTRSILIYSATILLAAFAGSLIIDIDKFMIPQVQEIQQQPLCHCNFRCHVVEVPARACNKF